MRSIRAAHCSTSCCFMPSSFCTQQTLFDAWPIDSCNHGIHLIRDRHIPFLLINKHSRKCSRAFAYELLDRAVVQD